jgi:hypothetical protein
VACCADVNGKLHSWEAVVLLPFIDEDRLLPAMRTATQRPFPQEKYQAFIAAEAKEIQEHDEENAGDGGRAADGTDEFGRQLAPDNADGAAGEPLVDPLVAQFPMNDGDTSDDESDGGGGDGDRGRDREEVAAPRREEAVAAAQAQRAAAAAALAEAEVRRTRPLSLPGPSRSRTPMRPRASARHWHVQGLARAGLALAHDCGARGVMGVRGAVRYEQASWALDSGTEQRNALGTAWVYGGGVAGNGGARGARGEETPYENPPQLRPHLCVLGALLPPCAADTTTHGGSRLRCTIARPGGCTGPCLGSRLDSRICQLCCGCGGLGRGGWSTGAGGDNGIAKI